MTESPNEPAQPKDAPAEAAAETAPPRATSEPALQTERPIRLPAGRGQRDFLPLRPVQERRGGQFGRRNARLQEA